jgi:hypothetical protein
MQAIVSFLLAAVLIAMTGSSGRSQNAEKSFRQSALELSKVAAFLRLRFNDSGKAQELDKQNLNWYVAETEGPSVRVKAPFYGDCPNGEQPFVYRPWLPPSATVGAANNIEPGYCLQKSKTLVFVLLFEKPISAGKIRLSAHEQKVTEWDGELLSNQLAVVSIHGGLKNVDLEIAVMN